MRVLIALGGNALLRRNEVPDAAVQLHHVHQVATSLALTATRHQVVITHGNGPQVGLLALESGDDHGLTQPYPLDALVAETQGLIGYWLQQSVASCGLTAPIVSLVTQTVVSAEDPAFDAPTKFIGASYSAAQAEAIAGRGWIVKPDGPAWRRVVPSPSPLRVVETPIIRSLLEQGTTVICGGGGGAPVVEANGVLTGVEAVVDKDHVAALLAEELDADLLVLLTDVPAVMADYGTPKSHAIGRTTTAELAAERFAPGSMGPKVEASCRFVDRTGHPAVIGALDDLSGLLSGAGGTRITPVADPATVGPEGAGRVGVR